MTVATAITEMTDKGGSIADLDAAGTAVPVDLAVEWYNSGMDMVVVLNNSVGAITATLVSQPDQAGRGGAADPNNDVVISVPAGEVGILGPAARPWFNAGSLAKVTFSVAASVEYVILRVKPVS